MRKIFPSESGFSYPHILAAFALFSVAAFLAVFAFAATSPTSGTLSLVKSSVKRAEPKVAAVKKRNETAAPRQVVIVPTVAGLFYLPLPSIEEMIIDGPHPPEPAEPPQPRVLKKLQAQFEPKLLPAIAEVSPEAPAAPQTAPWLALGPAPIPNGQTEPADANGISLTQAPVSGRTTAIVIDPADANIAYVGTAQGG